MSECVVGLALHEAVEIAVVVVKVELPLPLEVALPLFHFNVVDRPVCVDHLGVHADKVFRPSIKSRKIVHSCSAKS